MWKGATVERRKMTELVPKHEQEQRLEQKRQQKQISHFSSEGPTRQDRSHDKCKLGLLMNERVIQRRKAI